MDRYEICLSGSGGQGLILAGKILAEAVAIYEGRNAVQTQSYGPEARGGASRAEVVISDHEIDYPKALKLDLLLCLTQESCTMYASNLKDGGILIVDSRAVDDLPAGNYKIYSVPIAETAVKKLGRAVVTNIVALGIIAKISGMVSEEAAKKAILAKVPRGTEDLNIRAFEEGLKAGEELLAS